MKDANIKVVQMGNLLDLLFIFHISRAKDDKSIMNNLHQFMRSLVLTPKKRHAVQVHCTSPINAVENSINACRLLHSLNSSKSSMPMIMM